MSTAMPPAALVASTSISAVRGRPASTGSDHPGRGLVLRPGVGVDAGRRRPAARPCRTRPDARPGRPGTGPRSITAANLAENSPQTASCGQRLDQAERGGVPERGRAAVAEHDLDSPSGSSNSSRSPSRIRRDQALDRRPAGGWCRAGRARRPGPASAAIGTLDGPEPKRPSTGLIAAGQLNHVRVCQPRYRFTVGDVGPALDLGRLARRRADVAGGRAHEATGALLLEDVRAPAGGAGAAEHRAHHVRRHLGEVEDDRGPELDVGLDRAVGAALAQLRRARPARGRWRPPTAASRAPWRCGAARGRAGLRPGRPGARSPSAGRGGRGCR